LAAATGVRVLDAAGRFVEMNGASCRMYGYTCEELLGQPVTLVAPPGVAAATVLGNETRAISVIATTERALRSGKIK
jgi:PAS domain S-box-containing protein